MPLAVCEAHEFSWLEVSWRALCDTENRPKTTSQIESLETDLQMEGEQQHGVAAPENICRFNL
jgi:hypothetical protein